VSGIDAGSGWPVGVEGISKRGAPPWDHRGNSEADRPSADRGRSAQEPSLSIELLEPRWSDISSLRVTFDCVVSGLISE
jgi:hypothetical protein